MTGTLATTTAASSATAAACTSCSVRAHCMAASVEKEHIKDFEDGRLDMRVVHKGQHLFRTGEPFEAIYVVRSGAVKATMVSQDGTEQVSGFYLPGEIFGLDGVEAGRYGSNAIALETSSICVYTFSTLLELAQASPGLQHQLFQQASREISMRQRMLMTMGHRSAEARLAEFLLSLSGRFKRIGYSATTFNLPMSRQDIGDYLGLSVETVCRVLTRFQKGGTITREQREITLQNFEALLGLSLGAFELRTSGGVMPTSVSALPTRNKREQQTYATAAG